MISMISEVQDSLSEGNHTVFEWFPNYGHKTIIQKQSSMCNVHSPMKIGVRSIKYVENFTI